MAVSETPCTQHEEQIHENSKKISELETRADYKDKRIDEIDKKMDKIDSKIDNLTDTVNKVMLNSIKDDNNLNQRVTTLETTIKTQNDTIKEFEEKARKQRDEDRSKTNLRMGYITVGIAIFTFVLTYVLK